MNVYWTVVTAGCAGLFLVLFVIGETYAFKHNKKTLSRWVHDIQKTWPLFGFLIGFVLGALIFGLAVHFFWHWCPDLTSQIGIISR